MNVKNSFRRPMARLNLVLWQPLAGYGASLVAVLALLTFRLSHLVPGFSAAEQQSVIMARSLKSIFENPLFAPHAITQYIGIKSGHTGFIAMRMPSVLTALLCAALFFYVCQKWFNFRVASIVTILFVTSSWYLTLGRMATPEVILLGLIAPLAYAIWLPSAKKPLWALALGGLILVEMLYIPGFIWFAIAGLVWQRKSILTIWRDMRIPMLFVLFGCLAALAPLIIALAGSQSLLQNYAGLPTALPTLTEYFKNLALIPIHLVVRGPNNPATNLDHLPLLDFFTAVIAFIGAYGYAIHLKLHRSQLLFGVLILGSLLAATGSAVTIAILLPFLYLLVAGGVNFMHEQWFKVFPFNPLARSVAAVLIVAGVVTTSFYHINRYFIAWPQTPSTKTTYSLPPIKP